MGLYLLQRLYLSKWIENRESLVFPHQAENVEAGLGISL